MGTQIPNLNYKSLAEVPKDYPLQPTPDVTVEWLRIDERAVVPQYAHDGDIWARPIEMFPSNEDISSRIDNTTKQKYRFERIIKK